MVETVLSTDKYRSDVLEAKRQGLKVALVYVAVSTADLAVGRVRMRALDGGHDVPQDKIRSRYQRSLANFFWFMTHADWALVYCNDRPGSAGGPTLIARKDESGIHIEDANAFPELTERLVEMISGELPAEPGEAQKAARASALEATASAPVPDAEMASLPAILEWHRLAKIAAAEPERVVPAFGWAATEAALDAGALAMAAAIAQDVSALARARAERSPGDPEAQRDLSVSLDNVGRVAEAQGEWAEWAEAEAVYRESLAIARRVADAVGQTPQSLQDLGGALVHCAGIVTGPEKISLLREAEATYRRLVLKDKLANVGRMLKEAGEDRPLQGS